MFGLNTTTNMDTNNITWPGWGLVWFSTPVDTAPREGCFCLEV